MEAEEMAAQFQDALELQHRAAGVAACLVNVLEHADAEDQVESVFVEWELEVPIAAAPVQRYRPGPEVPPRRLEDPAVLGERREAPPLPDVVLKTSLANLVVQRSVTHGCKHRTDAARVTTRRDAP